MEPLGQGSPSRPSWWHRLTTGRSWGKRLPVQQKSPARTWLTQCGMVWSSFLIRWQRNPDGSVNVIDVVAERYERRSLGIMSNLVFSEWERIFANPMATAAAIAAVVTTPSSWSLTSPPTGLMQLSNGARPRR